MNQLYAAIAVGLVGVICIMDSRMLGRLSLERPLIGATMVGIVLGDIPTALAAGATLELMSIGLINVGAAMIPRHEYGIYRCYGVLHLDRSGSGGGVDHRSSCCRIWPSDWSCGAHGPRGIFS